MSQAVSGSAGLSAEGLMPRRPLAVFVNVTWFEL